MEHDFYERDDGLAHCKICNGGEGSLPTDCPGEKMTADEEALVYAGKLDYCAGGWIAKVCRECGATHLPGANTCCSA